MADKPVILFVCVHNAGRSQMAAGYARALSNGSVDVRSGGSEPGDQINPIAIQAMAEEGIDISEAVPQLMTTEQVREADVVITMGCGDVCPIFPGKRYEDWDVEDPRGKPIEDVRAIRDDIRRRVERLLTGREITEISPAEVDRLEPLWVDLLHHHHEAASALAERSRGLTAAESWAMRRTKYLEWFERARGRAFLATRDGEAVGYCFVHISSGSVTWDWGADVGVLETLVVAPGDRSTGLGSQLIERGLQAFRDAGVTNLTVTVMAGNDAAARLYERLGAVPALVTYAMPVPATG